MSTHYLLGALCQLNTPTLASIHHLEVTQSSFAYQQEMLSKMHMLKASPGDVGREEERGGYPIAANFGHVLNLLHHIRITMQH